MATPKKLKDLRGPQTRIARLAAFYREAFVHMLLYRIMIPLSILYGVLVILYLVLPGLGEALKIATAVVWVVWTPQFLEVAKGLSLAWSRGMAFGHLNPEFGALYRTRYEKANGGYVAFPFVVLALWAAGFVILLVEWQP